MKNAALTIGALAAAATVCLFVVLLLSWWEIGTDLQQGRYVAERLGNAIQITVWLAISSIVLRVANFLT